MYVPHLGAGSLAILAVNFLPELAAHHTSSSMFLPTKDEVGRLVNMLKEKGMMDRLDDVLQEIRPMLKHENTEEIEFTIEQAAQWSLRIRTIMTEVNILPEDLKIRSDEQEKVAQELVEGLDLADLVAKSRDSDRLKHRIAEAIVTYFRERGELAMTS